MILAMIQAALTLLKGCGFESREASFLVFVIEGVEADFLSQTKW